MRRPPTSVRRVTLIAAVIWILLHLSHAVVFSGQHRQPVLLVLAVVLALTADAVALAPLFKEQEPRLEPVLGMLLAGSAVVVTAGVTPFLTPHGLVGYANWPMGGLTVLVAALTIRSCLPAALLAATGMIAVNAISVWRVHAAHPDIGLTDALLLSVPVVTWLTGALAVRSLVARSQEMTEAYRRRQLDTEAQALATRAVREADDQRRADLRTRVLPLLERLAERPGPLTDRDRTEASAVAQSLRDDLRARSLLTPRLREQIVAARARGVRVSLSSDRGPSEDDDALLVLVRDILADLLGTLPDHTSLTCRITSQPDPVCVLVVGEIAPDQAQRVADRVLARTGAVPAARVRVDLDHELLAHIALEG